MNVPPCLTWPKKSMWFYLSKPLEIFEICLTFGTVAEVIINIMDEILCCAWEFFADMRCTQVCTMTDTMKNEYAWNNLL